MILRSARTARRLLATTAPPSSRVPKSGAGFAAPAAPCRPSRSAAAAFAAAAGAAVGSSSTTSLRTGIASLRAATTCSWDIGRRSIHSSSAPRSSSSSSNSIRRLGLGSTKWNRLSHPQQYVEIVGTALRNGVTVLEAGPEGGDRALCDAILQYCSNNSNNNNSQQPLEDGPLEILVRVGYRLQKRGAAEENVDGTPLVNNNGSSKTSIDDELGGVPPDNVDELETQLVFESDVAQEAGGGTEEYAVHNVSPEFLEHAVRNSPVPKLKEQLGRDKIQLTVLLHNPEVQQTADNVEETLAKAFSKLEEMDQVDSFGVSSNGLCLPQDHPLHLDYNAVLDAAQRAGSTKFRVVQLPVNALETAGVDIARRIQERSSGGDGSSVSSSNVQIYSMRPLTCYPDQGTGTGRPFLLTDYQLPATMEKKLAWTHEMEHAPQAYEVALKTALQHFDADELLEKKAHRDDLTPEERETLDGCKLMQSVIHDLDVALPEVRSFAAHEDTLYGQVIPVIQDTFESYDESTAQVLQTFFGAYSLAVRYHVAKNTRYLLQHGERNSSRSAVTYSEEDLPASKRLQEFALEFVLKQKIVADAGGANKPAIDKVILGCSQPIQVVSAVNIVKDFQDDA